MNKLTNPRRSCQYTLVRACMLMFFTQMLTGYGTHAQTPAVIKVGGTVSDTLQHPIPRVTVTEKGTGRSTATDLNGRFELKVADNHALLSFSSIGYLSKEVPVGDGNNVKVTLFSNVVDLGEVVVIGYGTQRKTDVTGAVASVKAASFVKGNIRDVGQLLQGKVAGLTISTPSGDPARGSQILLRGTNSIMANNPPLVIIDGVPGDLKTVAPEDIEQIDILKDGSAAAIYGTRATGGVLLVTTKRPKGNGTEIGLQSYLSTENVSRKLDLLDATQFRKKIADGAIDPSADYGGSTDWQSATTRRPFSNVHNLTIKSGNAQTSFIANLNYRNLQGIFINSDNTAIMDRIEVNHSMWDNKIKINLGINGNNTKYTTTGDGISFNGFTYRNTIIANPTMPVYIKGNPHYWAQMIDYGSSFFLFENPVARLKENVGENSFQRNRYYGNISFFPVKGLRLNSLISVERFNEMRGYAESFRSVSALSGQKIGYASRATTQSIDKLMELTADYNKSIKAHHFTFLVGYGYQKNITEDFSEQNWNFPSDQFSWNNIGLGQALTSGIAPMESYKSSNNLISFFSRVNYSFKEKYLVSVSVRHEGSSKFIGSDKPWGTFPAVSFGWILTKERFLENTPWLNSLKLRAGYGKTGTQPNSLYQSLYRLRYTDNTNTFYYGGQFLNLLVPASNQNPAFTWEKKTEYNLGIDFSVLKGRISGSIDGYYRRTKDLLFNYQVPIPPNTFATTLANVGVMENKGVEVLLNFVPVTNVHFAWNSTISFSTNANRLLSLFNSKYPATRDWFYPDDKATGDPIQQPTHRVKVGESIGQIWGWKATDIAADGKWIYESKDNKLIPSSQASDADRRLLGNGLPKYYFGFNNSFQYKAFDLAITMRGAFKFQVVNFSRMFYENPKDKLLNKLSSAYDKVFGKAVLTDDRTFNSYYVENGDFWKIDNVTLGYNLPARRVNFIKSARIYVSSLNTLVFTKYKGVDPEVDWTGLQPGNDSRDKYPSVRSFTIGVNLNF